MNIVWGTQQPYAHKEAIIQRLNSGLIAFSLLPWWAIQMAGSFSFFSFLMANLIMAVISVWRTRRERWATKLNATGIWYLSAGKHDTYWWVRSWGELRAWFMFRWWRHLWTHSVSTEVNNVKDQVACKAWSLNLFTSRTLSDTDESMDPHLMRY